MNNFFKTKFQPITDYTSFLISDIQYIEFIKLLGPIEVSFNDYLILGVSEPASYKNHFDWWQDKTDERGEHIFDIRNPNGTKTKDVQLIAFDSELYFWGYDISKNPPNLVGENFGSVFDTGEFILILDSILKLHEEHLKIKIPHELKIS